MIRLLLVLLLLPAMASAQNAVLDRLVVLGPAAKDLLTREQLNKLPPLITIFLDEDSIRAYKPGNSNGRGRFGRD